MAKGQLATGHQGVAFLSLRGLPRPACGWSQAPNARWPRSGHARRRGLARGRTPLDRRTKIPCVEPVGRYHPQDACRRDQAIWVCEQAHQQLKEELGLDHFEGRSWTGLHRHALMTMIAYAFLQSRRLKAAGWKKRVTGPPPHLTMPAVRQAILDLFARPPPLRCPQCEMLFADATKPKLPK